MARFIEITNSSGGNKVIVNVDQICTAYAAEARDDGAPGGSIITFNRTDGKGRMAYVPAVESYDALREILEAASS